MIGAAAPVPAEIAPFLLAMLSAFADFDPMAAELDAGGFNSRQSQAF